MTYTCILCYKEHICNYERNLTKYLIYESIKLCLCVVITCGTNETMDNTEDCVDPWTFKTICNSS